MSAPNPPGGRKTRKLANVADDRLSDIGSFESSAWNEEIATHRKRLRESKTPKSTRKTAKKEPKDGAKEPVKIATKSVAKPQKPIPRKTTEDRIIVQQNKLFDNVKGFNKS